MRIEDLSEYEQGVIRRALRRATTSSQALLKAQAVDELVRDGIPAPVDRIKAELEWIAGDPFAGSFQGARAARMAVRLLGILNGESEDEFPSETPQENVEEAGYWPYREGDPMFRDQFEFLRLGDTHAQRDRWRTQEEGPPPWKRPSRPVRDEVVDPGYLAATDQAGAHNREMLARFRQKRARG